MLMQTQSSNSNLNKLSVVILEDEDSTRLGMRILLMDEGIDVIGMSADPEEIVSIVKVQHPDVAFIDLQIWGDPDVGKNTIQEIRSISPTTKCIVRTAYASVEN